mgnify:CR=1 FL=1
MKKIKLLTKKYFYHFQNKNIKELENMFSDKISLRDWSINGNGKKKVLSLNSRMFQNYKKIKIKILNLSIINKKSYAEISINIKNKDYLVLDIIEFDKKNKIKSIKAFKGS